MKEISNGEAKGFSDAALMIRYLYMLLSKAAESAHRRPLAPTGAQFSWGKIEQQIFTKV